MDVEGQRSLYHKGMVTDTYILVLHHFHNYTYMIKETFAKNYLHQDQLSSYFTHHHVQQVEILCSCHSVHLSFA